MSFFPLFVLTWLSVGLATALVELFKYLQDRDYAFELDTKVFLCRLERAKPDMPLEQAQQAARSMAKGVPYLAFLVTTVAGPFAHSKKLAALLRL